MNDELNNVMMIMAVGAYCNMSLLRHLSLKKEVVK